MPLFGNRISIYVVVHKKTGHYFLCPRRAGSSNRFKVLKETLTMFEQYRVRKSIGNRPLAWFVHHHDLNKKDFYVRTILTDVAELAIEELYRKIIKSYGSSRLLNRRWVEKNNTHPALSLTKEELLTKSAKELIFPEEDYNLYCIMKGQVPLISFYKWVN